MATFEKGILGGFSGKVGNVVGARWRGKDIMRSVPVRGAYTPTPSQLEQQERFTVVAHFLTPMKPIVGKYFGKKQGDKSVFNLATSYHIKEAVIGTLGAFEMDYTKVLISKGELRGLANPTATAAAAQVIDLAWTDNSGQGYANADDQLMVVAYCENLDIYQLFEGVAQRDAGAANLSMPAFLSGERVLVWATFAAVEEKDAATSTYLGEVILT